MDNLYVAKSLLANLLDVARDTGVEEEALGLVGSEGNGDAGNTGSADIVPLLHFAQLYEYLEHKTGDLEIGLHVGERYNMAALGVVGQLIQVSRTVGEGLNMACEHFNLVSNALQISAVIEGDKCLVEIETDSVFKERYPAACKHMVHASMVFALRELQFMVHAKDSPLQVSSTFTSQQSNEFQRIFGVTVHLGAYKNALVFNKTVLDKEVIYADYELLLLLEKVACERLAHLQEKEPSLSSYIQSVIYKLLDPALPQFHEVAAHMSTSTRSLQRKLQQEGTSYSELAETVKKDLAMTYLKKNLSIKEVSYLMGYTEPSSFVTAFKRWFGKTPKRVKSLL
mgnify:CR=1 FL=1